MSILRINRKLLPIKAHYFFFYSGIAPVVLFMPTYAKYLGFSSVMVGLIYTVLPMVGMLSKPIMGAIADRLHIHKLLVVTLLACAAASWFSLMYIPPLQGGIEVAGLFECNRDELKMKVCTADEKPDKCMDFKLQKESKNDTIKCHMACQENSDVNKVLIPNFSTHFSNSTLTSLGLPSSGKAQFLDKYQRSNELHRDVTLHTRKINKTDENKCLELFVTEVKDGNTLSCETPTTWHCRLACDSNTLNKMGTVQEEVSFDRYQFWVFIILMIIGWIGMASITNIGDTICFNLLSDVEEDYGDQRLWGSVGWGVISIMSGLLMDRMTGSNSEKNYSPLFYTVAVLLGLDVFITSRFKKTEQKTSVNFIGDVGRLLMDIRVVVFIFWCILAGVFNGVIGNFLFWHLEDIANCEDQDWIKTLEGLYTFIQSFGGEIPFFFLNGWLLRTIGNTHCMSLVLFAFALKFLFYSMLVNPWYCLPIGLLNGITFSTFYATMASHAAHIAAPGTEATIQGLVGAVYEGVGVSMGSFLAGVLFYYVKGTNVFQLYGAIAITMCILHCIIGHFLSRNQPDNWEKAEKDKGELSKAASVSTVTENID